MFLSRLITCTKHPLNSPYRHCDPILNTLLCPSPAIGRRPAIDFLVSYFHVTLEMAATQLYPRSAVAHCVKPSTASHDSVLLMAVVVTPLKWILDPSP